MRKAAKNLRRPPASLYRRDIAAAECRRGLDRIDAPFAAVSRRVEVRFKGDRLVQRRRVAVNAAA